MATNYSAIYEDSDYWDGTIEWGYDATSDSDDPTPHVDESARDAQYVAAYTSMSAWEAARDGDSNGGDIEHGVIQGPWSSAETNAITFKGWDAASALVYAIGVAKHNGIYGDKATAYKWEGATIIMEDDVAVTLRDFQASPSSGNLFGTTPTQTSLITIDSLVMQGGSGLGKTFDFNGAGGDWKIYNSVIHGEWDYGGYCASASVVTFYFYNCSIETDNHGQGLREAAATFVAKNCAVFNTSDDFNSITTIENCASDDGDGDNPQTLDDTDNYAAEFTDMPNGDFSLVLGSVCIENGQDNPGSGLYSVDIIDIARSSTWDIGAFEYVSEEPPVEGQPTIRRLGGVNHSTGYNLQGFRRW